MIKQKRKIKINPLFQIILGFIAVILVGAFFLCLPISSADGHWLSFLDSIFTSTSAVCVTGLVVVDTALQFSLFGQIVILFLIQIGGLGFITFTTFMFLLAGKKISYGKRIAIQESLNKETTQGTLSLVRNIVLITISIELIGALLLAPSMISAFGWGSGIFNSIFLSISAFCNAGFDKLGTSEIPFASLSAFSQNVLVLLPIMFLIILGGIGFVVLFDIRSKAKRQTKKLTPHTRVVLWMTLVLILGGSAIFALCEWNNPNTIGNMSFGNKLVNCFFQSITPRTAGFATFDQAHLTPPSRIITTILMFIGGSPSSTAGGIKTTTLFILFLVIFKNSTEKGDVIYKQRKISRNLIQKCFRVFCVSIALIVLITFLISLVEGHSLSFESIFFEVISAISTVGLSVGITPLLAPMSKILIILTMFIGRIGAATLTFSILSTMKKNIEEIEYQEYKIMVG